MNRTFSQFTLPEHTAADTLPARRTQTTFDVLCEIIGRHSDGHTVVCTDDVAEELAHMLPFDIGGQRYILDPRSFGGLVRVIVDPLRRKTPPLPRDR